jgi:putative RecB family exonuclease
MPTTYSHSRLSSFENCKKQFHFRYVLQLPVETEGIEAFVGKRVHEVLERLYKFVGNGMVPSVEKVVARYHVFWDEHYDADRIRIVRTGTPVSEYRSLGERCLRNYYRRNYPFDRDETLGIEEKVNFDLDEAGEYPMVGFIDRVVRARDGAIEIHDYKTGRWVPPQKNLDKDRQLALYQIGMANTYGADQPMRLVWHYVQHDKVCTSSRTPAQLVKLKKDTISLIDRIGEETEFAPKKINLCSWCEYKPICPLWEEAAEAPEPAGNVTR